MCIRTPARAACVVSLALVTSASAQCPPSELSRTSELTAGDENYGQAIDFDGAFMITSALRANSNEGAAYIYRKEVDVQGIVSWVLEERVSAGDPVANENYGWKVSISGETAVVGTFAVSRPEGGAAFVYVRQPDGFGDFEWIQQQKLIPTVGVATDVFGAAVAIEGDRIAVGSIQANVPGASLAGAVYIFERSGTVWTEIEKVFGTDAVGGDRFGESVALEGDRLAVGATGKLGGAGQAYVFDRVSDGGGGFIWQEQARLIAPVPTTFARLGQSVTIDGDVVVSGAHNETIGGNTGIGAIYIYERDGGGAWPFAARFDPLDFSNAGEVRSFGRTLDMDAGNLVVGAGGSSIFGTSNGAAVLLQKPVATWEHVVTFHGSDSNVGTINAFGWGVSVVAGEAMISALGVFETGQPRLGVAYHFKLNPEPLLLTQHPSNALVLSGSPAAMTIVASGEGALNFQWSRNGAALVDDPNISGATTDSLSIASVGVGDIGAYDCSVTNACGTLLSNPAAISFAAGSCAGDANGSGDVTFADITTVLANWLNICP